MMDKLQVGVVLLMMLDSSSAQLLRLTCQLCPEGYYVTRNCTARNGVGYGTKCSPCTDCSESLQQTVVPCSAYTDSVCMNRTTPVPAPAQMAGSSASLWIGLGAASLLLLAVVLLLVLVFTWKTCRTEGFVKLLPLNTSSPVQKAPPLHQAVPV